MYIHIADQISSYNSMGTVKDSYKLKSIQHGQAEFPLGNGCMDKVT